MNFCAGFGDGFYRRRITGNVLRDILRILQSHELRRIEAGIRITEFCTTKQQVTTDSVQICCA